MIRGTTLLGSPPADTGCACNGTPRPALTIRADGSGAMFPRCPPPACTYPGSLKAASRATLSIIACSFYYSDCRASCQAKFSLGFMRAANGSACGSASSIGGWGVSASSVKAETSKALRTIYSPFSISFWYSRDCSRPPMRTRSPTWKREAYCAFRP